MRHQKTKRTTRDDSGYARFEVDAELHIEPEILPGVWGQPELRLSYSRVRESGKYEVTQVTVKIPRDTITRLAHEIRKLHERERLAIAEDQAAFTGTRP